MRSIKRYKKEDEGGREALLAAVVSTWQTRAVTLWGRCPRFSSSSQRTCQEKIKFQAFQVTTSWETTRLAMQAEKKRKCKKKRDSDIELVDVGSSTESLKRMRGGTLLQSVLCQSS